MGRIRPHSSNEGAGGPPESGGPYVAETERDRPAPYVVSADVELLMADWTAVRGFRMPEPRFFGELRLEFCQRMEQMFPVFEFVPEYEMRQSIENSVAASEFTPVSLDGIYHRTEPTLEIGRHVDLGGQGLGTFHRPGSQPKDEQYDAAAAHLRARGVTEIALVDDVLYEGNLVVEVRDELRARGVEVREVCAGIAVGGGVKRMDDEGIGVRTEHSFPEVIDEVCERDFYPGVPFSGKTVLGERNMGLPYILPLGRPDEWATIPDEHIPEFSRFCLHHTARMFDRIGEETGRDVTCHDIDRTLPGLEAKAVRYSALLHRLADEVGNGVAA